MMEQMTTSGASNPPTIPLPTQFTNRTSVSPHEPLTSSTGSFAFTQRPLVAISDIEVRARVQWGNLQTKHFSVSYDKICYHEMEASALAAILDETYATIFSLTHEGFFDRVPIYLCDLRSPSLLGRKATTHFNVGERSIYLVRSAHHAAEAELAAMVVHATRFGRYLKHYGITAGWAMLEDAFATFITDRITQNRSIYPFFGTEPDVIAQHLLDRSFFPSLSYAWQSIRFSSEIERKVLGGAFLLYLGDTASDDKVISFAKCDDEVTSHTFETYFRKSLEGLESSWMEHLPKTLLSFTGAEQHEMIERWNSMMSRLYA